MNRRTIIILIFSIMHTLALITVAIPYHRDIAVALLICIFSITIIGTLIFFIIWKMPYYHGLFHLLWTLALLVLFFVAWGENWFTEMPDEGELPILTSDSTIITGVPNFWLSSSTIPGVPPYGEAFAPKGRIFQPLSTVSDLAFISAGFIIILIASLGASGKPSNNSIIPIGNSAAAMWNRPFIWYLGFLVIFMGPASMYLHASFRNWAGWFDSFSVYNLGLFGLSYAIFRVIHYIWRMELLAWIISIIFYISLAVLLGLLSADNSELRIWFIGFSIALWLLAEIIVASVFACKFCRSYFIAWWWGLLFIALFTSAGIFKFFIEESSKYTTAFQPHALFHILAASALPFAYLYWVSERTSNK